MTSLEAGAPALAQLTTTKRAALSPSDSIAASFERSADPSVITVTFWVPGFSPFSILMDLKPESFLNAELTLALQPPQVTPVMPATYVTSPAIAGTIAKAANAIVAISFFMIS